MSLEVFMKKNKIEKLMIILICFFAVSCSSVKKQNAYGIIGQMEESEKKLNEQDGQNKTNIEWGGWDKTSNRPIDYKNGLINIKINPKQGAFCFYVIKEETVTDEEINKIIQSIKKENSKASKKLQQKLKEKKKLRRQLKRKQRVNIFKKDVSSDKNDKIIRYIPVMSTVDEYVLSGFHLNVDGKSYKLNDAFPVRCVAREMDDGCEIFYLIPNVAVVSVKFECFSSDNRAQKADMVRISSKVKNIKEGKGEFALKLILDTVLGETDGHHFYVKNKTAIENETIHRRFSHDSWFLSKNENASMQILLHGKDISPINFVAFANYSTLNTSDWEPIMYDQKTFNTIDSYNNTALCINWIPKTMENGSSFEEVFYLAFADKDVTPNGMAYIGPLSVEDMMQVDDDLEYVQKMEADDDIDSQVDYDIKSLRKIQLTTEYIRDLINEIVNLENSDTAVNRTELLQLNAELDAILSVLRQ